MKANLEVVVDLNPQNVEFGVVTRGSDAIRLVHVVGKELGKTKLRSVMVQPLGTRGRMTPAPDPVVLATLKDDEETPTVELSIAPNPPAGNFYGQLVVLTDNPRAPRLTARVRVKVQASVAARPERLRFAIPEEGGEQVQELVVRSVDGQPLKVLEVVVQHPSLKASFEPVNERRTKITVTCSGETRRDRETTALSIRTSNPDDPQLAVPVEIFRLKRAAVQTLQTSP